jgi:catechol 2,3-dioxygenase-like lactoylglutathione lyase family enzyme
VAPFLGFDHIDVRVSSLALVESFYDRLMPALGLEVKSYSYVDGAGEWLKPSPEHPYNTIEYHERPQAGSPARFIGFIEAPGMLPVSTRIAFALATADEVRAWEPQLRADGARAIEFGDDFAEYPALFFEDPAGTRLELCARRRP